MENGLLRVVLDDLKFLAVDWNQSPEVSSLRRSSPALRKLLVQNELQKAWNYVGFPKSPKFMTYLLDPAFLSDQGECYLSAFAGGALAGEFRHLSLSVAKDDCTPPPPGKPEIARLPLASFLESPSCTIKWNPIKRRILIQYVANKLCGDHYDPNWDQSPEGKLQQLIDAEGSRYPLNGIPQAYYELLSIGLSVLNYPDIERLSSDISRILTY